MQNTCTSILDMESIQGLGSFDQVREQFRPLDTTAPLPLDTSIPPSLCLRICWSSRNLGSRFANGRLWMMSPFLRMPFGVDPSGTNSSSIWEACI